MSRTVPKKHNITDERAKVAYAAKHLWGVDFDDKTAKISRAIMLIAGDGKTHIFKQNSLEHNRWSPDFVAELQKEELINDAQNKNLNFDIVMSNPPFAGDIPEKNIINLYENILGYKYTFKLDISRSKTLLKTIATEFEITWTNDAEKAILDKIKEINKEDELDLEQEDDQHLAAQEIATVMIENVLDGKLYEQTLSPRLKELMNFKKNSTKWEKVDRHILFIERVIDLLKDGGRAVIVLPQGIFNNSNEKYVRKFITSKARILAVIGLHGNSFKPHTGTKTSLIFLQKYSADEVVKDYPIFFATSKLTFKDNSGEYIFLKDAEGNIVHDQDHNPIYQTDLYDIAEAFYQYGQNELSKGDKAFTFLNN